MTPTTTPNQRENSSIGQPINQQTADETTMRTGKDMHPENNYYLEKHENSGENLWWRKFVQYIKKTKNNALSKMTNSKEITIPRSTRTGDQRHNPLGNRTKSTNSHGKDDERT